MNVTDPIGDMLTRIRNAQQRGKSTVVSPSSRLRERVLEVLQAEGYIRGYSVTQQGNNQAELQVELKYFDGEPGIREIKRVSKPGRRVYASVQELPTIFNGLGVAIMSTSKGVMSDSEAREQNVGGEVLCTVF